MAKKESNLNSEEEAEKTAERRIAEWKRDPWATTPNYFGGNKKTLELGHLGLKRFPESIRHLKDIEGIDAGLNEIQEIPNWIGELKNLMLLGLDSNHINKVPSEIGNLSKLTHLYLRNNRLTSLPDSFQNLPLESLSLHNNSGLDIPESLLESSPKEVLRYYFESRIGKSESLKELKLLVVGRGKAGKTTLIKQLAGEPVNENESETHSIAIKDLSLNCLRGNVRTRAWDFGGQEILHSTHQFFLTERSLYLLVLEPRSGLAQRDAEYWLKLIETQGNGSPAIIVMNYSHERRWKVDEVKLRRKFPFIVDFISTDALLGDGIEELHLCILKTVEEKMPDVWFPFPSHWRNIKDHVAGMHGNFLTYNEYVILCNKFGEERPDAQADLASILHALGLALYFGNDPRLHDTRVLNPSWVTGGVYAVIRSPFVSKNDGQLSAADMSVVLQEAEEQKVIDTKDYPKETHGFILELMRAFQLCYASEEKGNKPARYLVPELLPEFEPAMTEDWNLAPVKLRYRYEILPPGLLSRLIVRTHELSEDAPHWRHGVVLRHVDAQALIREESDRYELHVFILGVNDDTRRTLVTMVRRELELLHTEMKVQSIELLELSGDTEQWISVKSLREVEKPDAVRQKLPVQPDGTADVDVATELNKLIPADVRAIDRDEAVMPVPVRLFVSYAHEDERQLKRLDALLDVLEQQYGLTSWVDKRLIAGDDWKQEIVLRLANMDIFLFIASQSSLASPYIRTKELQVAKARQEAGEIEVVTVKLEPCAADEDPFLGNLQRLANKFKSIAQTSPRSLAWEQVRLDLLPVIKKVREKKMKGKKTKSKQK